MDFRQPFEEWKPFFKNFLAVARHGPPDGQGRRYFRRKGNKTFDNKTAFEFDIGKGAEQLGPVYN